MKTDFRQFIRYFLLLFTLLLFVLLNDCQNGDPVGLRDVVEGSNNLITGEFKDVVTKTIDTGGGTIKVDAPDDPLNGFEIKVAANSFTQSRTFEIARAEIKSHNLGPYFNPISPLIRISNAGDFSDQGMTVKVPVKIPKGHFAMGFFYDQRRGTLEGLPIEALDSSFVTVSTRHFATTNVSSGKLLKPNDWSSFGNLIISSIEESRLSGQVIISSGFKPGVDDWEFVNYGSYLAYRGNCAGQSMTAMWYYYEKKLNGGRPLFHKYDKFNDSTKPAALWQDNPTGYKFASVIQEDFNWNDWIARITFQFDHPALTWKAFALAMLTTGEPQLVLIRDSVGKGAHAMIVYQINFAAGKLYIADPNFPNNRDPNTGAETIRTINFSNDNFDPYPSSLTAGASPIMFDQIGYFAKTAYINWGHIGKRWTEFESGKIGTVPPNTFPEYKIMVIGKAGISELGDKLGTDSDSLIVETRCPTSEYVFQNTENAVNHEVYNETGKLLASTISDRNPYYRGKIMGTALKLKPGLNKLGYVIYGKRENAKYSDGSLKPIWIDFRWVEVTYQSLEILSAQQDGAPILIPGEPNKEYKFVARSYGSAPAKAKYIWNFGDGTPEVTVANDSTARHTFTAAGDYTMTVNLYNSAGNTLVGTAQTKAVIVGDLLKLLQKCKGVRVDFRGLGNFQWNDGNASQQDINDHYSNLDELGNIYANAPALSWNGASFAVEFSRVYASPYFPDEVYTCKLTISGNVASDGKSIINLSATEDRILQKDSRDKSHNKVEIKSLPLTAQSLPSAELNFIYDAEGDQVKPFISGYEYVYALVQESGTIVKTQSLVSLDWSTPLSGGPRNVSVSFSEKK